MQTEPGKPSQETVASKTARFKKSQRKNYIASLRLEGFHVNAVPTPTKNAKTRIMEAMKKHALR